MLLTIKDIVVHLQHFCARYTYMYIVISFSYWSGCLVMRIHLSCQKSMKDVGNLHNKKCTRDRAAYLVADEWKWTLFNVMHNVDEVCPALKKKKAFKVYNDSAKMSFVHLQQQQNTFSFQGIPIIVKFPVYKLLKGRSDEEERVYISKVCDHSYVTYKNWESCLVMFGVTSQCTPPSGLCIVRMKREYGMGMCIYFFI